MSAFVSGGKVHPCSRKLSGLAGSGVIRKFD